MATPYGNITHSPFSSSVSVSQPFPIAHVSSAGPLPVVAQSGSPAKESVGYNPVLLCRKGQETIQEILSRTTEVFQCLRYVQMPNGVNVTVQQFQDRKHKLDEQIRQLEVLFRKLRFIYDSVNQSTANLPSQPVEELLSYVDADIAQQENNKGDEQQHSTDEERELVQVYIDFLLGHHNFYKVHKPSKIEGVEIESLTWSRIRLLETQSVDAVDHHDCAVYLQLQMKNRQLKEIIDQLRTIIWEINTMMTMRRTVSQ